MRVWAHATLVIALLAVPCRALGAPPPNTASAAFEETTNARLTLRSAEQAVADHAVVRRVQRGLAGVDEDVTQWGLQPVELWRLPRRELGELNRQWKRTEADLVTWQHDLDGRKTRIEAARAKVQALRSRWSEQAGPASGTSSPTPPSAGARSPLAASVLAQAAKLDAVATARLAVLSRLRQRVVDESPKVAQIVSDVGDAREHALSMTMQPVAPPLWRLAAARAEGSLGSDAKQIFAARRRAWASFFAERGHVLWTLLVLLVAMASMLWMLRRRHLGADLPPEATRLSRHLLARPVSAAILLTVLTAPFIVSAAPPGFYRLLTLLLLIPLLRLLAPLVPAHVRPLLYGLAGLMVIDHIRGMFAYQIFVHRLLLLAEAAIAGAALWLWLVRKRDATGRALRAAATGGAVAFGVSALANVAGYVSLADVLVSGLRVSAYVGVVLYAGTMVLDAVFVAVLHSHTAQRLRVVRHHREIIHRRMYGTVAFAAVVLWLLSVLAGFALIHPVFGVLHRWLTKGWRVGGVHVSLSRVLLIGGVLWASSALSRLLRFLLDEEVFPRAGFGRGKGGALSMMVGYAVLGCGILVAMGVAGIDATQVAMLAGALGVGIGFGLQNIVSNFVAGIILILERPVNIGDFIEVDELVGEVQRIGVRSSTVRALDGAEVIVPNERLISKQVINWTLTDRTRRIDLQVGVAYGTSPERVLSLLEQVAASQPGVLAHPRPMSLFRGFGDSSLDFELLAWVADYGDWRKARSELGVRVHAALEEAGIEIPFPQRDLHVRSLDPALLDKLPALPAEGLEADEPRDAPAVRSVPER